MVGQEGVRLPGYLAFYIPLFQRAYQRDVGQVALGAGPMVWLDEGPWPILYISFIVLIFLCICTVVLYSDMIPSALIIAL